MPLGVGGGAAAAIQQILADRAMKEQQAFAQQQAQAQSERENRQLQLQESSAADAKAYRQRGEDRETANARELGLLENDPNLAQPVRTVIHLNRLGVKGINSVADVTPKETAPPKRTLVAIKGPKGEKVEKSLTDDELSQGVEGYVEPKTPPQGAQPQIFYDSAGNAHAIQFSGGKSVEVPLPDGLSKAAPKPPEKLPQREDDTVVSIHQMMPLVDELLSGANQRIKAKGGASGTVGQIGQRIERGVQNTAYKAGIANPTGDVDKRIQLASLLQILGTVPYLRGIRNMQFVSQIQQHLADPTATDESISERLNTLKSILPGMEQAIYDVHNKGVIPHEHTGAMSNGGAQDWVRDASGKLVPK